MGRVNTQAFPPGMPHSQRSTSVGFDSATIDSRDTYEDALRGRARVGYAGLRRLHPLTLAPGLYLLVRPTINQPSPMKALTLLIFSLSRLALSKAVDPHAALR